jgi:hypothetical protein
MTGIVHRVTGQVFISYAHDAPDAPYVAELARFLASQGLPVWYDRELVSGERWHAVIQREIDTCSALIVVMSPKGDVSPWVNREIAQAEETGKPIFPLLLSGTRFFRLADLQYEDVRDGSLPGADFVARLRQAVSAPPPSTSVDRDPPQWLRWAIAAVVVLVIGAVGVAVALNRPSGSGSLPSPTPTTPIAVVVTRPLATLTGHTGPVTSVAFTGHTVATGGADDRVMLWNVGDLANPAGTFATHGHGVLALAFSPDGQTLATGGSDGVVRLWNVANPATPNATLRGHSSAVVSTAFSPAGHLLATGDERGQIRLWNLDDLKSGSILLHPTDTSNKVTALAFGPDGRRLASAEYSTGRLWNLDDPNSPTEVGALEFAPEDSDEAIDAIAFDHSGQLLATGGTNRGTVRVWRISTVATLISSFVAHDQSVTTVQFSPDDSSLATASADHLVRLWGMADPKVPSLTRTLSAHTNRVVSVAYSSDGHTLATASDDQTTKLWSV